MSSASTTRNHDEIRKWVEARGGHPAVVAETADNDRAGALLRIDYDEPSGNDDDRLRRIGWDEFFEIFDENDLAFLHQDKLESGDQSRFSKFVSRETAEAQS